MLHVVRVVAVVALSSLGAGATNAEVTQSCNVDFTTNGLPICVQVCIDWCWATVIGEFKEYYLKRNTNDTPFCRSKECDVVGKAIGTDCCKGLDQSKPGLECGIGGKEGTCAGPVSYPELLQQLYSEIPSQKWQMADGPPSEAQLQQILMSGNPVGRAGDGHIDAVVGCRPCQGGQNGCPVGSGGVEYRVIDSMVDPATEFWWRYDYVIHPIPSYQWKSFYYSSGPNEGNVSSTASSDIPHPQSSPQLTVV